MYNGKFAEPPLRYLSRGSVWMGLHLLISFLLIVLQYLLMRDMRPLGFILLLPTLLLFFHALWSLLNPFASQYKDYIELKVSLFYQKTIHFNDVKKAGFNAKGQLIVEYKDGEFERVFVPGLSRAGRKDLIAILRGS